MRKGADGLYDQSFNLHTCVVPCICSHCAVLNCVRETVFHDWFEPCLASERPIICSFVRWKSFGHVNMILSLYI
jgi:hypothetical protein